MDDRQARHPGGTCFFSANLLERHGNDLPVRNIESLRSVVQSAQTRHPFVIRSWVV